MPSSLRSKTHSGPAGRSAVSTAFIGVTKSMAPQRPTGRSVDPSAVSRREPDLHASLAVRAHDRRHDALVAGVAHQLGLPTGIGGGVALLERLAAGPEIRAGR